MWAVRRDSARVHLHGNGFMIAMLRRIFAVAWKETRHLARDRLTIAMILVFPTVQFLLFGFAINTDARHLPLAVLDRDASAESRDVVRQLEATTYFDVAGQVRSYDEAEHALRAGRASAVLVVPAGFAANRASGMTSDLQLLVDGSDPLTVSSAANAAAGLIASFATQSQPVHLVTDLRYNPEQRTAVYIVPGLIGVILTLTMVMMTSSAISRERERGTIEALIVSPVKPWELMMGKLLPFVAIGYVQMTLILLLGWALFGVAPGSEAPALYAVAALFIACNLAVGLVFSTMAATQFQAMQLSFFFLLPNVLLSGFMFPVVAMPLAARAISEALPLTHFLRCVRGMILKQAQIPELTNDLLALIALLAILMTIAVHRFRKQML
jgi:ABC-2 type transport system permease protein